VGTKVFGPVSIEIAENKTIRDRFAVAIKKSGGIV